MTTKVRIEIEGEHLPVLIERSDGLYPRTIQKQGEAIFEFVHGTQTLTIREIGAIEAKHTSVKARIARLEEMQGRPDTTDEDKQSLQAAIDILNKELEQ